MSIFRFFFRAKGLKELKARLKKMRKDFGLKGMRPVRRSIVTMLLKESDKKLAASARGSLPKDWKPLSKFTVFVRGHRAQRKNRRPQAGVDSGVMRLSTRPFEKRGGKEFGIENRLKRARLFNFGGISSGSTIQIGSFTRKTKGGGTARVRSYRMKISGGHKIPARPFFPTQRQFAPLVKRILKDAEKRIARGKKK